MKLKTTPRLIPELTVALNASSEPDAIANHPDNIQGVEVKASAVDPIESANAGDWTIGNHMVFTI
jgi:hypothetical protein